jgi:hypothetical protein
MINRGPRGTLLSAALNGDPQVKDMAPLVLLGADAHVSARRDRAPFAVATAKDVGRVEASRWFIAQGCRSTSDGGSTELHTLTDDRAVLSTS